jgi:hypothetical protein
MERVALLMEQVGTAASDYDIVGVASGCRSLKATLDAIDPAPASAVNAPLQKALNAYRRAATLCVEGARNFDAEKLAQSSELLLLGSSYSNDATDAIVAWTATHPSV